MRQPAVQDSQTVLTHIVAAHIVTTMKKTTTAPITGCSRRRFLRRTGLLLAGVAGGALPGMSWAVRGDQLHIRNYNDTVSLDPPYSVSGAEGIITRAIYQNLLQFKPDGSWDTRLDAAEHFEQVDPTHYAFRLKAGLEFSNGFGEMTADDVKFSLERLVDPAVNAINAPDMGPLSHVEVHDRYSGTLVLESPFAAFTTVGLAGPSGSILSREAVMQVGGRFSTRPPCCSGPYLFSSWQAKRKTVLKKNPDWQGPEAAFSEIHVYAMTDDKASEMAFESGQLDCAQISVESIGPFQRETPPDSYVKVLPSARNYWLGINQSNAALTDLRVRQAIQHAVDAEAVVEAAWFGMAEPSTGAIAKGMLGWREKPLVPPKGDPDKARALLAAAAIELPLRLRLDVKSDTLELTAVQVMQWSLKKVGIEVEIRAQDNNSFLQIGREDAGDQWQDVQLFFQSFIGMADPYYSLTWFVTEQMGVWNWERFSNAEYDRLNALALAETDTTERARMYQRMQDLMEQSGCYRFITNGVMPQIIRTSVVPAFRPDGYALLREFRPA